MELGEPDDVYERVIHYDQVKEIQLRLTVNVFRGVEYLSIRKYYLSFDEEWLPTRDGVSMPLDLENSRELFTALVDIISLAESKDILETHFKEQIDNIYLQ